MPQTMHIVLLHAPAQTIPLERAAESTPHQLLSADIGKQPCIPFHIITPFADVLFQNLR